MRALSAFILLGLLASGQAAAQEEPKLPMNGWVRADYDTQPSSGRAWIGVTLPSSPTTAFVADVIVSDTAAGLNIGQTFEIGALYLTPMVGAESSYEGEVGAAATLLWAFEAPPLPIYLESWTRATLRSPFGGSNDVIWQLQALATLRSWLALGPEYDAVYSSSGQNRLGLRANIGVTNNIVLGVFAGYEFNASARAAATGAGPDWLAARGTINFNY
jgi:hypothetical protein